MYAAFPGTSTTAFPDAGREIATFLLRRPLLSAACFGLGLLSIALLAVDSTPYGAHSISPLAQGQLAPGVGSEPPSTRRFEEPRLLKPAPVAPAPPVHNVFLCFLVAFGLAMTFGAGTVFVTERSARTIRGGGRESARRLLASRPRARRTESLQVSHPPPEKDRPATSTHRWGAEISPTAAPPRPGAVNEPSPRLRTLLRERSSPVSQEPHRGL
jgi:hypothetical protein